MQPKIWALPSNLENQNFNTLLDFDSADCWDFSGTTLLEMLLGNVWGQFSPTAQQFFISNNFCDSQGNFALSRRYSAVNSGVKNLGNFQLNYWTGKSYSVDVMGFLPRSLLDFSPVDSTDPTYPAFVNDFFNPQSVTFDMISLAKEALKYISVTAKDSDPITYEQVTQTTPVQLGIPIPKNTSLWNAPIVAWDGGKVIEHAVVGRGGTLQSIPIGDSYTPWSKVLTGGYYIGIMTVPTVSIVSHETLGQETVSYSIIQQFINILIKIGLYPKESSVIISSIKSKNFMKFLNNTFVHVVVVGGIGALAQWLSGNVYGSITLATITHYLYEWLISKYPASSTA